MPKFLVRSKKMDKNSMILLLLFFTTTPTYAGPIHVKCLETDAKTPLECKSTFTKVFQGHGCKDVALTCDASTSAFSGVFEPMEKYSAICFGSSSNCERDFDPISLKSVGDEGRDLKCRDQQTQLLMRTWQGEYPFFFCKTHYAPASNRASRSK